MERVRHIAPRIWLSLLSILIPVENIAAQSGPAIDYSVSNLMVVLRESEGRNKPDEVLTPFGRIRAEIEGKEIETEVAWFNLIGDMHIRFVFDSAQTMRGAKPEDLTRLNLTVEQALEQAVANIKRVYGAPTAKPWTRGAMIVEGKSPDFNSSYFLDRTFWRGLLAKHPDGIVVGVPKRGGLIFAPVTEKAVIEGMRSAIVTLHSSSGSLRVSSALFLFKNDRWTVFQAAQTQ